MAGAFDHALHAALKGVLGKLAQVDDFFPLGSIARVHASAGAQAIAQRQGDVVGAADVEQAVEIFQQRIFAVVFEHPAGKHGAAARNNAQHAVVFDGHFCAALGKAAVNGDKVHALLGLFGDFVKQGIGLHGGDVLLRVQNLLAHGIEGHGSEGQGAGLEHAQAQRVQIARNGKIHHRIGSGFKGGLDLALFGGRAVAQGRRADVGVYLDARGLAHKKGLEVGMRGIAQQDHGASLKGIDNGLRCKLFFLSKGGEVFVQQSAQGGILRKERCRHGVCLAGCDAGRKKKPLAAEQCRGCGFPTAVRTASGS